MSVTYPVDPIKPYGDRLAVPNLDPQVELANNEPFVPVYARSGKSRTGQAKIKTWMILVPVGAIVLSGIGAMLVMNGGEAATTPLAEPAATAPVLSALPLATETAIAPLTPASTPEPVIAAAPVRREAAPIRRTVRAPTPAPAPARREATARVETPVAAPRTVVPAPAATTGPRPYTPAPAVPATSNLSTTPATPAPSTAPATATAPAPPPVIVIQPLD